MVFLRSLIFTIIFYFFSFFSCAFYALCSYFIKDQKRFIDLLRNYMKQLHWLEKVILNIDFEVRGAEHLPKDGLFIVASKHQSSYETMKLHLIFDNPSAVLKKELFDIPFWGRLAVKSDVIKVDRSSRIKAIRSVREGTKSMIEQKRPIVIYPQGTRVDVDTTTKDKPYKFGVARMYEDSGLPIIPMAINSGYYYPKKGITKRPGKVVFEFLPPIPAGKDPKEMMKELEEIVETASQKLLAEARQTS